MSQHGKVNLGLLVALCNAVRAREQVELRLRESQDRLRQIVTSSPAVVFAVRADRATPHFTWISENVVRLLGYQPEVCVESSLWWSALVHPDDLERALAEFARLPAAGAGVSEYRFRHASGRYVWLRDEKRIAAADGAPREIFGSWSDISDRKGLEDQVRHAQKMEAIGRLAGGIAHDFNNILTVINGFSDILLRTLEPAARGRRAAEEIKAAGKRAANLTRKLLTFSRRDLGSVEIFDMNVMLVEMQTMLQQAVDEDVAMSIVPAAGPCPVAANRVHMEQVIMNLALNARDAMPGGGRLEIRLERADLDAERARATGDLRPGAYAVLTVADTGCGMDGATQARIFEPFFTTKPAGKGTGLGLATVDAIVKEAGGAIRLASAPGTGTTFTIYLARQASAGAEPARHGDAATLHRGAGTVLLVEDDPQVRSLIVAMLREAGYGVLEAGAADEALALFRRSPGQVDLVISDLVMPRVNGRDLAEQLRTLQPDLRVLFMSGYSDDEARRRGVATSSLAFLAKPFTTETLTAAVQAAFGAARH